MFRKAGVCQLFIGIPSEPEGIKDGKPGYNYTLPRRELQFLLQIDS
jgi:dihydroxyacid dehydratase/phosphogluconate dehydratase